MLNKIYFKNIDSIRFFAALMVFLQHTMYAGYAYINNQFARKILYAISNGGIGVSIFFVLSGFLITYLILSEIETAGNFSLKNFYMRRILRIWPLYFAIVLVSIVIFPLLSFMLHSPINKGMNPLYQLTFLSNFDAMRIEKTNPGTDILMQNITWSVSIEEQFYVFWPLIFAFLPKKLFLPAIVSIICASLIFRLYHKDDSLLLYFHTLAVMIDLATGALFAYLIVTYRNIRIFFQQTNTLTIIACVFLFFFSILYGSLIYSVTGFFFFRLYFSLLFAFIIASQAMAINSSPLEFGNISFANKWGKYTYGIYLLHPISIELIHIIVKHFNIITNSFLSVFSLGICSFILTLFFAFFSYTYFEKRFLSLKRFFNPTAMNPASPSEYTA